MGQKGGREERNEKMTSMDSPGCHFHQSDTIIRTIRPRLV